MENLRAYRNEDYIYSDDSNSTPNKKFAKDLAAELSEIFRTGENSDFIVFVKGRQIQLHKFVLRSLFSYRILKFR